MPARQQHSVRHPSSQGARFGLSLPLPMPPREMKSSWLAHRQPSGGGGSPAPCAVTISSGALSDSRAAVTGTGTRPCLCAAVVPPLAGERALTQAPQPTRGEIIPARAPQLPGRELAPACMPLSLTGSSPGLPPRPTL
ncbi:hypothetical protein PVAP13_3KG144727 [Panicum virgatum]|uniref:Uncharacterized protein n=1 Tax=Panicum virgatum TaxID=38727 RepID=A0A8T0UR43_PANVG|nr:hypothetical protein PVAP13_3KG144727 [Panicum virgatum]